MYELLIWNQLGYKVKLLLDEVFYCLDVVVCDFLYVLDMSCILLAEVLPDLTETVK